MITLLFTILSQTPCCSQNYKYSFFGNTYMHFFVSRTHNYRIVFEAVTTSDSVKIDLSNFDAFVSSVCSNCK